MGAFFLAFYMQALAWSFPLMEMPDYRFLAPPTWVVPIQWGKA